MHQLELVESGGDDAIQTQLVLEAAKSSVEDVTEGQSNKKKATVISASAHFSFVVRFAAKFVQVRGNSIHAHDHLSLSVYHDVCRGHTQN